MQKTDIRLETNQGKDNKNLNGNIQDNQKQPMEYKQLVSMLLNSIKERIFFHHTTRHCKKR